MGDSGGSAATRTVLVTRDGTPPDWAQPLGASGGIRSLRADDGEEALAGELRDAVAVLIDAEVGAPVSVARRVHRVAPGVQIAIVAADTTLADLRRAMLFAPGIGEVWLVEPREVTDALIDRARAVGSSRRRHSVRSDTVARKIATLPRTEDRRVLLADRYLAVLLQLLPDPVLALDDDDSVLFANPAAASLLRLAGDAKPDGEALRVRLAPEDPSALDALLDAGRRAPAAATLALRAKDDDGTFDVAIAPISGERPARALLLHDVTEQVHVRRQLEEQAVELEAQRGQLQEQNEELQAQAEELQSQQDELLLSNAQSQRLAAESAAVLGQIADGVIIVDAEGTLVFANAVAQQLHGQVSVGRQSGEWTDAFELLDVDGRPLAPDELPLARALQKRETVADADWLIRRMDGSVIRANGSAAPVVDPHGISLGAVITMRDVTQQRAREEERERLLEERDRAVQELTEAMRHRSRFYASMSHELRTPINAIIGYNDLMLSGVYGAPPPEQVVALERVQQAATHLLELVNDVLDLSKIEAGKLTVAAESVHVAALLDDLGSTMQPLADANDVELYLHAGGRCDASFRTDPRRVRQIVMNLLSNAIRYGSGKPVEVCCKIENGWLRVDVEDHGPGIPREQLERIFEEFVQASDRAEGGTGLGLAIGRSLAHALGGTLTATSAVGKGSTFTLRLPEMKETPG